MVVKYHTLASHSNHGEPGGVEEMSGGDTSMAGEGSIVAGTGVDVDIVPPSTVKVGKAQAEELAGMTNELKRKLRDITAEQLGQEPKLKKVRLQCALLLRGVQFNPKDNQDALRQKLIATLGAAAGRLEKVPKQIDASVECAFWGARADPC